MKKIILLITLSAIFLLSSETKKYIQPEFYSIGMLPEGYSFVCLDGHKWLQHEERDKVVLQKLYYEDEETGKILPHKCH
jgi:hypothetical protein